jgi:hypothetical protein
MASIIIKDLSDNLELDRKAMQAIMGGSRLGARPGSSLQSRAAAQGIVNFGTGLAPRSAPSSMRGNHGFAVSRSAAAE